MYKHSNYKLYCLTPEELAAEICQDLTILYPTGISVLYSAQCMQKSVFRVQICLKSLSYFDC